MDNEEGTQTRSRGTAGSPNDVCEYCGSTIATNDWYPIAKERTPDGSLQLYPFCCDDCKARWEAERSER